MRRVLVVLCGMTLLTAGCNDAGRDQAARSAAPSSSQSPSASPSASSVAPAVAANTRQVCGELKKVMEEQTVAFLTAGSRYGDVSTITDPAKQAAIVDIARKSFRNWAMAVRPLSSKAKDPALRKAIDDQATALDDTAATLTSVDQLTLPGGGMASPSMQVAARETKEICG